MEKLQEVVEAVLHLHEKADDNFLGRAIIGWGKADVLNLNNRIYPLPVLSAAVQNLDKEIQKAGVAGDVEHPGGVHTRLDKVSHVLEKVWMKAGKALAQIRILNTTAGRDTMTLIKSGVPMGASSRGIGEIGPDRKIRPGLIIKSIDLVSAPSFGKDAQITKANIIESYIPTSQDEDTKMKNEEERLLLGRYYLAIHESKYKGSFEDFKKGKQIKKKIPDEMEEDNIQRRHQEAADSGYTGSLADYKKLLAESKLNTPQTLNEQRRFAEAQASGFTGSLVEWRQVIKKGEAKMLLQEAMYPPELEEIADYSFKELSEIPKKILLERYHQDIADGEFEGSFYEWLSMKKEEEEEHEKKELRALDELTHKPQV